MKSYIFLILMVLFSLNSEAQFLEKLSKKAEAAAKRSVERKVEQKTEKTTDKAVDGVLNPEKKSKKEGDSTTSSSKNSKKSKSAKSANDFVAGTKVIASESFSQDAIGDFPVNWATNSSGEVVTFDGENTRWLKLTDKGNYSPINFTKIPENCTFEFDLYATDNFSFYSTALNIVFAESKKKTDYTKWGEFKSGTEGVLVGLHPQVAGNRIVGSSGFKVINKGGELMSNQVELTSFNQNNNTAKVQFWRQKNRLRMYVNGDKVWDLPNAFQDANYNSIVFYINTYSSKQEKYYISNLRLAEASADTRHKLIETGTFTTNEILFDSNKATIKSSSASVLKDLGNALKENPSVKVKIIGYTDSDGKDADNQKLSVQRAESVKNYLASNFGIDKSRMTTDGKGEIVPVASNDNEDGKKQNRRVEFNIIK